MTNSSSSSTKEWFLWGVVVDLLHLRMVLWEEEEEEGAGAEVETMVMEEDVTSDLKEEEQEEEEGAHILMQSYSVRALGRRLQVDWARDPREGPRVLMSLRVDFEPMG